MVEYLRELRPDDLARYRIADHVAGPRAEQRLRLRVPFDHLAQAVDADHRVQRRCDQLLEARFRLAQRLLRTPLLHRLADQTGRRLQKGHLVVGKAALAAGVGEQYAENPRCGRDDHPGARVHAVKVAKVTRLEPRLLLQIGEGDRRAGHRDVQRDRLVLLIVAIAVRERRVRADGRAQSHPVAADLQRARVLHAEGELHQRAGLPEEDVGIDAGEGSLSQLGDGRLLPVAILDLVAQTAQLGRERTLGLRVTDEVKLGRVLSHLSRCAGRVALGLRSGIELVLC